MTTLPLRFSATKLLLVALLWGQTVQAAVRLDDDGTTLGLIANLNCQPAGACTKLGITGTINVTSGGPTGSGVACTGNICSGTFWDTATSLDNTGVTTGTTAGGLLYLTDATIQQALTIVGWNRLDLQGGAEPTTSFYSAGGFPGSNGQLGVNRFGTDTTTGARGATRSGYKWQPSGSLASSASVNGVLAQAQAGTGWAHTNLGVGTGVNGTWSKAIFNATTAGAVATNVYGVLGESFTGTPAGGQVTVNAAVIGRANASGNTLQASSLVAETLSSALTNYGVYIVKPVGGGTNKSLVISDAIVYGAPGNEMTLEPATMTANRTITFPDASGTVTLPSSNITWTGQHDFTGAEVLGASPLRFEGATDNNLYTILAITDPTTANGTLTVQNLNGGSFILPMDGSAITNLDGSGLTLTGAQLDVGAGTGITVNANNVALTVPVAVANGGTNATTALAGSSIMISNGASIVQGAAGTTTTLLHGNAAGEPTYSAVSLTTDVTGTLPVANGGTNATSYTAGSVIFAGAGGTSLAQDNANLFFADGTDRLGIGTATPSTRLSFPANFLGETIGQERSSGGAPPSLLILRAGGAESGVADQAGGTLQLASGIATGSGSSNVLIQSVAAGASGTADRTAATSLTVAGGSTATALTVPDNAIFGLSTTTARIEFDDQATDEINLLSANIGIGTSTPTASINIIDNATIGLSSTTGRIEFDDQATDEVNIVNANVGIGTSTPGQALDVVGTIRGDNTILSTRTTDIGWSVVSGANTACNTTCTNACVVGFTVNAVSSALEGPVGCASAAADICLCAGAN